MAVQTLSIPVKNALRKLGSDILDARLRRRIPAAVMAQRAYISRTTLVKVEKGDSGVGIGTYAAVLFARGMLDRLRDLASSKTDEVSLRWKKSVCPSGSTFAPGARRKRTQKANKRGRKWISKFFSK